MKKMLYVLVPALVLLGSMVYLLVSGERQAGAVREGVVRFHVVAASDSSADQQLKIQVRDRLFALIETVFADCTGSSDALVRAEANRAELEAAAREVLLQNGCDAPVTVEVGERYFPTKDYGDFSFPAGQYRAVSVRIGEARGQNFWCVLYPALCIAPAVAGEQAEDELTAVIGKESTDFLKKSTPKHRIRFAVVDWFEQFLQKYLKS